MAGRPDEYFLPGFSTLREPTWRENVRDLTYLEYVRRVSRESTTPNGVFGAKLSWSELLNIQARISRELNCTGLDAHAVLSRLFPDVQYIWITRRDKTRQAVSAWKALQTNEWNSGTAWVPKVPVRPRYDYRMIDRQVQGILLNELRFATYFHDHRLKPITITFEDFVLDYEGTALAVLGQLGIPVPACVTFAPRKLERQSNADNEEWTRRFLVDKERAYRRATIPTVFSIMRNRNVARLLLKPPLTRRLQGAPVVLRRLVDRI